MPRSILMDVKDDSQLTPVRVFTSEVEAEIAKAALDAFGVDSIINRDDCGGQRPHLSFSGGIQLLVRTEDAARAEEVLDTHTDEPA